MTIWRCTACRRVYARTPGVCRCGASDFRAAEGSGRGRVYSCTTLYAAAEAFQKDVPFQIAIIELEEGARLTARVTGRAVAIGDAVRLEAEHEGVCFFSKADD